MSQSDIRLIDGRAICAGTYVLQKGRFTYANQRTADILGYPHSWSVVGLQLWSMIHPEDRNSVCIASPKKYAWQQNRGGMFRIITCQGQAIKVRMIGANTTANGRPANIGCILDITGLADLKHNHAPLGVATAALFKGREAGSQQLTPEADGDDRLIGNSEGIQTVRHRIDALAEASAAVLITGESGTGKHSAARRIHLKSARRNGPFIVVDCTFLPSPFLESVLFGHVPGAFPGAVAERAGRFQTADGGTIVLDGIEALSVEAQSKVIHFLRTKVVEPQGATSGQVVDARIVATTCKDLKSAVLNEAFREELYSRLKRFEVVMPSLRQRSEDLSMLIDHFRQTFNRRHGRRVVGLSEEVRDQFNRYDWPGNIVELENAVERAVLLCPDEEVSMSQLPAEMRRPILAPHITVIDTRTESSEEARKIVTALNLTLWNKTKAAELLGVSRQTLYRKLKACNILEGIER